MEIEGMTVHLNNLRVYAYHGVMEQERRVGNAYHLNIALDLSDFTAAETDDLSATVNYAEVCSLVEREMAKPALLLETLAGRLARVLLDAFPLVARVTLTVCKDNPPMGADIDSAGVTIVVKR